MQQLDAENIIKKYQSGNCTPEEKEIIEHYIFFIGITPQDLTQMEIEFDDLKSRIDKIGVKPKIINWPFYIAAIAAAIIIILSFAVLTIKKGLQLKPKYATDISPGSNKAFLTLSNGKVIKLKDTQKWVVIGFKSVTYADNSIITEEGNKGTQRINTPKGGQYQIELPDGSRVWLNAASTLEYPVSLSESGERRVKLSGEAYFEITKDKKRPFIVATEQQTVQVLGTHFNINAYGDEGNTKTTLLEGSVQVSLSSLRGGTTKQSQIGKILLKPHQQAISTGNSINVKQVDPNEAIAWKNGEFSFNNEPLASIMPKLARWYDVDVSYANSEIAKKRLNGSISKFGNISEILYMLETTGEVHFAIAGRRITVMP